MEIARNLVFSIIMLVVLLAIVFLFKDQIFDLITKAQEEYLSSPTQEKEEIVEPRFRSLGISAEDPPEIAVYKLFRNFDDEFLNMETQVSPLEVIVVYYPFILDLGVNEYDIYEIDDNNDLMNMTIEGIRNFSFFSDIYQVGIPAQQGPDNKPTCDNPQYEPTINYDNDCWTTSLDTVLVDMVNNPNPCKILVRGDVNDKFNDRVKIRVGWRLEAFDYGASKDIIYTLITVCDG